LPFFISKNKQKEIDPTPFFKKQKGALTPFSSKKGPDPFSLKKGA